MKLINAQREYERLQGLWRTAEQDAHTAFKLWNKACDKKNKLQMDRDKAYGEWQFELSKIKQKES
jgi:hypothetical protein